MITPTRRLTTASALTALTLTALASLSACGTGPAPGSRDQAARHSASAPPRPATLAPGPAGLTPVFKNAPRTPASAAPTVALTFDADMTADQGPRAAAGERFDNPALVATLRRLKVPATFFMTGRWAEEYPAQAKDIGRDPLFEVANHSYSHYAFTGRCYGLPTVPASRMRADMERAFAAFRKAGVERQVPYFRFPGGCYDKRALRALAPGGVTAVQWDVVSGDAFATDADAVARQVLDGVRPGSVVVMHCTRSAAPRTEHALRTIVPKLRERGFRFVRVSEQIRAAGEGRAAEAGRATEAGKAAGTRG
ncbi:polysaccharide deacetylase family protein [Streptomyces durmitorensis]|uniref:Polysaccharide deacetylase family protein n=1 Tax=Streptomyces durmitorensis TaxID=319947 RepID=A0ABY4PRU5_9ACTN|nr:polysaccharide deacetylase family protein [Streptomyces durmitorensis]UQT55629.1 polysaccharide deacetylase family protein [Streptomyces durmitorensis]